MAEPKKSIYLEPGPMRVCVPVPKAGFRPSELLVAVRSAMCQYSREKHCHGRGSLASLSDEAYLEDNTRLNFLFEQANAMLESIWPKCECGRRMVIGPDGLISWFDFQCSKCGKTVSTNPWEAADKLRMALREINKLTFDME